MPFLSQKQNSAEVPGRSLYLASQVTYKNSEQTSNSSLPFNLHFLWLLVQSALLPILPPVCSKGVQNCMWGCMHLKEALNMTLSFLGPSAFWVRVNFLQHWWSAPEQPSISAARMCICVAETVPPTAGERLKHIPCILEGNWLSLLNCSCAQSSMNWASGHWERSPGNLKAKI